ncbi:MAG: hypothetical protein H7Y18_18930 [Clostridiaceae bacterium]|nr:hypothetical protein [Clostridiaceae bacterium]
MKRIVPYFLCICLLLLGCFYLLRSGDESQQVLRGQTKLLSQVSISQGIQVVAKRPFVKRGEIGVLALKCTPKVNCKVVCCYKINGKFFCATRNLVAGKDGSVLFTWKVDKNTDVGSYDIEITSGGDRLMTSYIVQ